MRRLYFPATLYQELLMCSALSTNSSYTRVKLRRDDYKLVFCSLYNLCSCTTLVAAAGTVMLSSKSRPSTVAQSTDRSKSCGSNLVSIAWFWRAVLLRKQAVAKPNEQMTDLRFVQCFRNVRFQLYQRIYQLGSNSNVNTGGNQSKT